jgi:hypothetical protein
VPVDVHSMVTIKMVPTSYGSTSNQDFPMVFLPAVTSHETSKSNCIVSKRGVFTATVVLFSLSGLVLLLSELSANKRFRQISLASGKVY